MVDIYTCTRPPQAREDGESTLTQVRVSWHHRLMSGKHVAFTPEENALLRNAWREFVKEHQLTHKEAGDALGIRQQNAGRLTSALPNVGIGRRTANLIAVKLGYPDAEHFLREH